MNILSVDTQQLLDVANAVSALSARVDQQSTLRYDVQPGELGGGALSIAVDALGEATQTAIRIMVADAEATVDNLRLNAARYTAADEQVATDIKNSGTNDSGS